MKSTALECIAPLLAVLRTNSALREVRPTVFHLNGRDFIHFHDEVEGLVADVRLASGRIRMPVGNQQEQAMLLDRIEQALDTLERHSSGKRRKGSG